jgi:hypothetical protein
MNSTILVSSLSSSRFAPHSRLHALAAGRPRRLSSNILRQIFWYCVAGSHGELDPTKAPLLLRGVSDTWKTVADSTPSLWSSIALTPPQFIPANVQVVKEWFERSGATAPLEITIRAPEHPTHFLLLAMLAECMPYSRRWTYVNLHIPVDYLPIMLCNSDVPLPSLEGLTLSIDGQPHFAITSAPRLRCVTLTVQPPLSQPQGRILHLAWNQITYLNIHTVAGTIEAIWDIFLQCPQLLTLIVSATNNPSIPRIPFHRHRLFRSKLRHLSLSVNTRAGVIGYFLDGLFLPDLQELHLYFTDINDEPCTWPGEAIIGLRDRCLAPLVKVVVTGKVVTEPDLVDFVRKMKYLEQLTISYGTRSLITGVVAAFMPRDWITAERLRAAYRTELQTARLYGRVV